MQNPNDSITSEIKPLLFRFSEPVEQLDMPGHYSEEKQCWEFGVDESDKYALMGTDTSIKIEGPGDED